MNEQFVNIYEELHSMQNFHSKIQGFFQKLKTELFEIQEPEENLKRLLE